MTREESNAYYKKWRSEHKDYMRKYMRENGHRLRGYKRIYIQWTDEMREEFKKMYTNKGKFHISEIAEHFGISKVAANSMARRLKVRRS